MSDVILENLDVSFEQAKADKAGTVYVDRWEDGVRVRILRGPCSLCAYVGIPESHPLAGSSYDDMPVRCHGGLTYADRGGDDRTHPKGFFWYGWDYSHCDDKPFYETSIQGHPWTVKEVNAEIWQVLYDLKRLMTLAEAAHAKGAGWRQP